MRMDSLSPIPRQDLSMARLRCFPIRTLHQTSRTIPASITRTVLNFNNPLRQGVIKMKNYMTITLAICLSLTAANAAAFPPERECVPGDEEEVIIDHPKPHKVCRQILLTQGERVFCRTEGNWKFLIEAIGRGDKARILTLDQQTFVTGQKTNDGYLSDPKKNERGFYSRTQVQLPFRSQKSLKRPFHHRRTPDPQALLSPRRPSTPVSAGCSDEPYSRSRDRELGSTLVACREFVCAPRSIASLPMCRANVTRSRETKTTRSKIASPPR